MSLSEFDLIRQYLAPATGVRPDVTLGIGDDCALLQVPVGRCLAVSMDTLVEGRHFLPDTDPLSLGYKSLAVNLSDLAAMGAEPAWATLSLTLPEANTRWLDGFMRGFVRLAEQHGLQLVGGDTTRGPLSITVQVHGFVACDTALRRSGGRPGDRLFVSGCLGDAALALARMQAHAPVDDMLRQRLDRPEPRVALGQLLVGRASAAIDVSDGLGGDLQHLCTASRVGARLHLDKLPLSAAVSEECARGNWHYPLAGGDDYELLFSVPPRQVESLNTACAAASVPIQEIGELVDVPGVVLIYPDGRESTEKPDGFDHFRI